MYFKNSSEACTVVMMTEVGKITVKPGEIVDIKHKIYAPMSRHIVRATEEEFLTFQEEKQGIVQTIIDQETTIGTDIIQDDSKVGTESTETTTVETEETTIETEETAPVIPDRCADCYADGKTPDAQKCENCNEPELEEETKPDVTTEETEASANTSGIDFLDGIKSFLTKGLVETPTEEETKAEEQALIVTETTNNKEIEDLEGQLDLLKQSWVEATKVKTKDKIAKQIKEVQKQIDKIKKHEDLINKQN